MAKKKVMVVDDSIVARQEMVKALQRQGFDTVEAENGAAGVQTATKGGIDVIITDVNMPELSGIDMCEQIYAVLGVAMPLVLVVSADASAASKERAKKYGVKGWVVKPANYEKVVDVVKTLIERGAVGAP